MLHYFRPNKVITYMNSVINYLVNIKKDLIVNLILALLNLNFKLKLNSINFNSTEHPNLHFNTTSHGTSQPVYSTFIQ